jgi:hypothetical protein
MVKQAADPTLRVGFAVVTSTGLKPATDQADATLKSAPPAGSAPPAKTVAAGPLDDGSIADPHAPPPTVADVDKRKPRGRSWKRVALYTAGGLVATLLVAGVVVAIFWSAIARALVERAAAARGVDLKVKSVDLSLSRAKLSDVDATFPKLPGIRVHADSVVVDLATLEPEKVKIGKLEIDADDPRAVLAFVQGMHGKGLGGLPAEVDGSKLKVHRISKSLPISIELSADHTTHTSSETKVEGISGTIPLTGAPFGPYALDIVRDGSTMVTTTTAFPKLSATIDADAKNVTLALAPISVGTLGALSKDPDHPAMLSGAITIAVPAGDTAKIDGSIEATLAGVVLPHPAELDDIVSGDRMQLDGKFDLSKEGLALRDVTLAEGGLALKGEATLTLANGGHLDATLAGSVACSRLAGSVLAARFGGGLLARSLAGSAVQGDVGVRAHLTIDAPGYEVHLEPTVDVGCSLGI